MIRRFLWAIPLLVLLLVGCGKKGSVMAGTWTTRNKLNKANMVTTTTFNDDGTFRSETNAAQENSKISMTAIDTGTWSYKDNKLTENVTDVQWNFAGGSEANMQRARDRFAANKSKIIAETNAQPTVVVTWKDNDTFSFTQNDLPFTFHRNR